MIIFGDENWFYVQNNNVMNYSNTNRQTIDYQDTSVKKYPYNKYYNYNELQHITQPLFQQPPSQQITTNHHHSTHHPTHPHSQTIDYSQLKHHQKLTIAYPKQSTRTKPSSSFALDKKGKTKKSMNMSVQNIVGKSRQMSMLKQRQTSKNATISIDNYKQFSKQQIAQELSHYTKLCLSLRRQNLQLKEQKKCLKEQKRMNLISIQQKLNRLNKTRLQLKQKSLQENKLFIDSRINGKENNINNTNGGGQYKKEAEFKRFFFEFMSTYGKIDDKLNRKVLAEKSMEKKLIVGHKLLKESATFLKDKKYKFNCFFD